MYKGHYINRLRFHINRHHTEYLRKVLSMETSTGGEKKKEEEVVVKPLHSLRVRTATEMAKRIQHLEQTLDHSNTEIERLCAMLDSKSDV